jgi:hypothetical protein
MHTMEEHHQAHRGRHARMVLYMRAQHSEMRNKMWNSGGLVTL